jgi:hypothetical protein
VVEKILETIYSTFCTWRRFSLRAFFVNYLSSVYCCHLMCICCHLMCFCWFLCVYVVILCAFVDSYVYLLSSYVLLLILMCICWHLMCFCLFLCVFVVPYTYLLYLMCICCAMCVLLFLLQMTDCWLEVSIRKVLRQATSTQVFLGFPVSTSECWDGSQVSKLLLHASHVALST